jgi:hypothetical protein
VARQPPGRLGSGPTAEALGTSNYRQPSPRRHRRSMANRRRCACSARLPFPPGGSRERSESPLALIGARPHDAAAVPADHLALELVELVAPADVARLARDARWQRVRVVLGGEVGAAHRRQYRPLAPRVPAETEARGACSALPPSSSPLAYPRPFSGRLSTTEPPDAADPHWPLASSPVA